ncbi:integrase [Nocardia sp. NPDC055321]
MTDAEDITSSELVRLPTVTELVLDLAGRGTDHRDWRLELAAAPADTQARIRAALVDSRATSTVRSYRTAWTQFETWCRAKDLIALPASAVTVADYLLTSAEQRHDLPGDPRDGTRVYARATLARWVAAINWIHATGGYLKPGEHELVKIALAAITRVYAREQARPQRKRVALLQRDIVTVLGATRTAGQMSWQASVAERRDALLLLLGWPGGFRRGELTSLRVGDLVRDREDGLHVTIAVSKTDQAGHGNLKAFPYAHDHRLCTPCAFVRWMHVLAAHESGRTPRQRRSAIIRAIADTHAFDDHLCRGTLPSVPARSALFRRILKGGNLGDAALSDQSVNLILRDRARVAGLDEAVIALLGGHSLRAGFVTQSLRNGKSLDEIMKQTGHRDPKTVIGYARDRDPLSRNAVNDIWGPGTTTTDRPEH